MAAVTIGARKEGVKGNKRVVQAVITFNASYATGGDSISPAALGLRQVDRIAEPSHDILDPSVVVVAAHRNNGISVELAGTKAAPLLKCYGTDATEVAAATNQSTLVTTLWFYGS